MGWVIWLLVFSGGLLSARDASLSPSEIQDGWVLLFDGESTFGLRQEGSLFHVVDGVLTSDGTAPAYIRTTSAFSDFRLKLDYRSSNTRGDAAVYIRTVTDTLPSENGYQIQLGDSDPNWPAGSILHRGKASGSHPAPSQWHTLEISALGEQIVVTIDQQKVAEGKDNSARAGFIGLKAGNGVRLEFRDVKLKPANTTLLFNGADLSGWKTATEQVAPAKPGKIKKMLHLGGAPKPREAEWSVRNRAIHGEKGPGQLNSGAMYEDYVLQYATRSSQGKPNGAVYLRGDTDKLFSGYIVKLDEESPGAIGPNLASPRRKVRLNNANVTTVEVHDRHIAVWVNGYATTEFTDTRAEGRTTDKNAKTSAGVIALPLQSSSTTADYTQITLSLLSKTLGGIIGKPAPAAPAIVAAPTPPLPPPTAQQQAENQRQAGILMSKAVMSSDPEEQKRIYSEVIRLDPANVAAMEGLKEAQDKIDKKQQEEQQRNAELSQQRTNAENKEAKRKDALASAQDAFYRRDLTTANNQLAIAESVAPDDPEVKALRQKIDALRAQSNRIRYFWIGGVALGLGALTTLAFLKLRRKDGYLQIVSGMDNGRKYNLDQEVVRIGAIAQDGGEKNDIVVRDMERMISRFHCEVHNQNGKFYVIDCNSANGTSVDKRRIPPGKPAQLKNGTRLDLAGTVGLRFGLERRAKAKQ